MQFDTQSSPHNPDADPYKIITIPDPVLKQTAQPITKVDDDIKTQFDRMYTTMRHGNGIGLAANQVGMLNRLFVMHVEADSRDPETPDTGPVFLANPEIIWKSDEKSVLDEGCLSLPGQYATIERPAQVRVKYLDYNGQEQEMLGSGLISHVLQHELDHLNGILFVDYLSRLKRDLIVKRVKKWTKAAERNGIL